jgi:uncharacterized damage-inducible protein DinB
LDRVQKGADTNAADVLTDAFGRIREIVHDVVDGLSTDQLAYRVTPEANSIAWLIWHLTRIQDDHVTDVAGVEQTWTEAGWIDQFALPFDAADTGFGHSSDDVAAVTVESGDLLTQYHHAVFEQTERFVTGLQDDELDRIVDERWDPPVSLGVRLVSVIGDDLQHAGQAAYIRGILPKS